MTVKTFISRPLLSLVISVFIVLLGVISLLSLPVERYPDIAPPAIYVWASYPGASAETVQKSVVMPLEEAINGVEIVTFDNTNDFLFASIREVILTLVIAIVLVLVVVLFFLQDFRATLIPAVGIVVSLIGTFAFMKVAGFSVNLLTLFALVLVIGTVVDDSIVVVEAVKAKLDEGCTTTRKASEEAMNGLSVTLFTTTLVFMVIFIPVAFVGGITREESQTSGRVIFIFLICIVFAYLVMVPLRKPLHPAGGYAVGALRTGGQFAVRQAVRRGEQHLHADRDGDVGGSAVEDGYPAHRAGVVCRVSENSRKNR